MMVYLLISMALAYLVGVWILWVSRDATRCPSCGARCGIVQTYIDGAVRRWRAVCLDCEATR